MCNSCTPLVTRRTTRGITSLYLVHVEHGRSSDRSRSERCFDVVPVAPGRCRRCSERPAFAHAASRGPRSCSEIRGTALPPARSARHTTYRAFARWVATTKGSLIDGLATISPFACGRPIVTRSYFPIADPRIMRGLRREKALHTKVSTTGWYGVSQPLTIQTQISILTMQTLHARDVVVILGGNPIATRSHLASTRSHFNVDHLIIP